MVGSPARRNILLVDDEAIIAMAEKRVLASAGYGTETATSGEDAVERVRSSAYDLVLMDIDLGPGMDGGEAARRIREAGGPPVVFLSSHSEETAIDKTRDAGAYGFIAKGSGDRILKASVKMALELSHALKDLAESEARWASLARNAADYIVSIGPDRRILFSNRPLGGPGGPMPGDSFLSFCAPEEREAVDRAIGLAFAENLFKRLFIRSAEPGGGTRTYEALVGPAGGPGKVEYLTAVLREQAGAEGAPASGPARGSLLPRSEAEILRDLSSMDFRALRPPRRLQRRHRAAGLDRGPRRPLPRRHALLAGLRGLPPRLPLDPRGLRRRGPRRAGRTAARRRALPGVPLPQRAPRPLDPPGDRGPALGHPLRGPVRVRGRVRGGELRAARP
jgi:CheY-like chemotaxis protein